MNKRINKGLIMSLMLIFMSKINFASEIKMLFAYTKKASIAIGGAKNIKAQVDNGIKLLNEALKNSDINCVVKPVFKMVEVDDMTSPLNQDEVHSLLSELRKKDGKYNGIHVVRQQVKADMVCLIFSGYTMGIAELAGDMMVCHYKTFGGSYVFPHEFGHNLGATHEKGYRFSYGGNTWRTVSNNGGVSVPYFSQNKTVTSKLYNYQTGKEELHTHKLGDAAHDNSSVIRKNVPSHAMLGENLGKVEVSPNALKYQFLDANTAPTPKGTALYDIQSFSVTRDGQITIKYKAEDSKMFMLKMFDKKGNSNGGTGTQLNTDQTEISFGLSGPPIEDGEKFELWIDEKLIRSYVMGKGETVHKTPEPTPVASSNTQPVIVDKETELNKKDNSTHQVKMFRYSASLGGFILRYPKEGKPGLVVAAQDQASNIDFLTAKTVLNKKESHTVDAKKFTDWRLPNKYELSILYKKKDKIGGFIEDNYWTRVPAKGDFKKVINFKNGSESQKGKTNKNDKANVRVVRNFTILPSE